MRRDILDRSRGWLSIGEARFACALGPAGPVHRKREGDGGTPAAVMAVLAGRYRADRMVRPRSAIELAPIRPADGWCDDVGDARYNLPVRLPFSGSHETMRRDDRLYDVVLVLDWNLSPRVRGRGSAIFFHLAHDDFRPTAGCVAVSPRTMRLLLPRIRRGTLIAVWR